MGKVIEIKARMKEVVYFGVYIISFLLISVLGIIKINDGLSLLFMITPFFFFGTYLLYILFELKYKIILIGDQVIMYQLIFPRRIEIDLDNVEKVSLVKMKHLHNMYSYQLHICVDNRIINIPARFYHENDFDVFRSRLKKIRNKHGYNYERK
ncbi:hypothetical protein [Aureibacter tunicatorum]|uniref:Uncharacterized protein n=1 Tax=Aureibacter tunicatorum TaxID=866807 RepID=A0AAE3XQL8_9BACT|nr:hypothetical protein [Aureibacter tunicatorum]MDR6240845.1 hypothetical protein [Aureibacter tunicatorum]BDD06822.1 hypothetical protein AUTU_43050 [Aureibacter tunicatorum]